MTDVLALPDLLREARHRRRLSQLDLALSLGVSARHLGFVEVGRSRPSRGLLMRWLERLEVPLRSRNEALLLAGFAPAYDESRLGAPSLAEARRALASLLASHDPLPALVLDEDWQVVGGNAGFLWLARVCGVTLALPTFDADGVPTAVGPSLVDLVLADGGFGGALLNLDEVAPAVLQHLRQDAVANPRLDSTVEALASLVPDVAGPPVLPATLVTRYDTSEGELAFLSMFTTFGTPQSITLDSLRVELLFAADDVTRATVERVRRTGRTARP